MRRYLAVLSTVFVATLFVAGSAKAEIITESDTGMVFGDLDCLNTDHEITGLTLFADVFDYLKADVTLTYGCVTRDGRRHTRRGADTVWFPELTFNWAEQAWYHGRTLVAYDRGWRNVELAAGLETSVWTHEGEEHIALKVQILREPQ